MQVLTYLIYLTAVLLCIYLVLVNLYLFWFSKLQTFSSAVKSKPVNTFSIIIPARNEEKNIAACLRSILHNNYPGELYEIIVADDFSTDTTAAIVEEFRASFENVKLIRLENIIQENINSYKKRAIEIAIRQSKFDWIITTDADCLIPESWLSLYDAYIQTRGPEFVAAPVMFINNGSFLSVFQCLDFISLQGITAASVSAGFHSMCNGANLAYRKQAFFEVDGFKNADHIASGDDMLLMHKIQQKYPSSIGYLFSSDAIVTTQPMPDWKSFFNQRIRWASKATNYRDKRIFLVLLLVYFLNLFLFALLILCFFYPFLFSFWLMFLLTKALLEMPFMYKVSSFFSLQKLMLWFVLMQPVHIIYTVISGWLGKFGSYRWKGRKVK